jgi:hypothetical protein
VLHRGRGVAVVVVVVCDHGDENVRDIVCRVRVPVPLKVTSVNTWTTSAWCQVPARWVALVEVTALGGLQDEVVAMQRSHAMEHAKGACVTRAGRKLGKGHDAADKRER